jgi:hypothetical protein
MLDWVRLATVDLCTLQASYCTPWWLATTPSIPLIQRCGCVTAWLLGCLAAWNDLGTRAVELIRSSCLFQLPTKMMEGQVQYPEGVIVSPECRELIRGG